MHKASAVGGGAVATQVRVVAALPAAASCAGDRPSPRGARPLADSLASLAGTPDDAAHLRTRLVAVAALAADHLAPVSCASVTGLPSETYTTVATSSEAALGVDLAQYAANSGPCLAAIETGLPVGVADIAASAAWPAFREAASRSGLRSALCIPLFAGSGAPIAVLNLYGHDPATMAPLCVRVRAVYHPHPRPAGDGGEVGHQLVDGIVEAFTVRTLIQRAITMLSVRGGRSPHGAYLILRVRAAEAGVTLAQAATAVIEQDA